MDGNSRHDTEDGFQVSKGGASRNKGRDFQAKGLSKGLGHTPPCIYRANSVYIVLITDCI